MVDWPGLQPPRKAVESAHGLIHCYSRVEARILSFLEVCGPSSWPPCISRPASSVPSATWIPEYLCTQQLMMNFPSLKFLCLHKGRIKSCPPLPLYLVSFSNFVFCRPPSPKTQNDNNKGKPLLGLSHTRLLPHRALTLPPSHSKPCAHSALKMPCLSFVCGPSFWGDLDSHLASKPFLTP